MLHNIKYKPPALVFHYGKAQIRLVLVKIRGANLYDSSKNSYTHTEEVQV